ncbi:MAG: crossover junction endodeoxyribonuclease RuvC [Alphaproteobacteria bacterium]|nr:MAG: crossover junction endodeoxyribonuclease RuvC [Alphaproteobacteria bacterium]
MRILGIDPGLRHTGWGVIRFQSGHLSHIAHGVISPSPSLPLSKRLLALREGLVRVIGEHAPEQAAIEEVFVNKNGASTLKLGMARGACFLAPVEAGLEVAEYAANLVKKSLVGTGHAAKGQVQMMIGTLLPGIEIKSEDAADALAVAVCHAHHGSTAALYTQGRVLK